ncbi:MAG: nucleotide exchange factor GrpE [Chloroflexi bacterium]|nr:nucleotide exchange factor GrpE [Chloroflexota bacterium]
MAENDPIAAADQQTPAPDRDGQAAEIGSAATDPTTTEVVDDVQALRTELDGARREAQENYDKFLRARADMENYKKRIERNYADLAKSSKKALLSKLLGVKDNLERALHYGESSDTAGEGILEGVRLTQYQLDQILSQEGVKPIQAEGKAFDPTYEDAVQSVNDPSVPDHTVIQVVRQGYTYGDENEVLRPAQVIVSVHQDES